MSELARTRANAVAEKYLGDCSKWCLDQLVDGLEQTAYSLARAGKTDDATSILIAVADLTKLDHVHYPSSDQAASQRSR